MMPLTEDQRARAHKIRAAMQVGAAAVAAHAADDAALMAAYVLFDAWAAGVEYRAGDVRRHGDQLYQVVQTHTSQAHQPPDAPGLLALYRPIQRAHGGDVLPWVYGEAIGLGDRREEDGVVYECYREDGAGANVHPPSQVASVWRKVVA